MPFVAAAARRMIGGRASDLLIQKGIAPGVARRRILYISAAIAPLVYSPAACVALCLVPCGFCDFGIHACGSRNHFVVAVELIERSKTHCLLDYQKE